MEKGFDVTILGSGTCVPSLQRSSCSVLMEIGDEKLVFDTGPGTMRRLLRTDTTIFQITRIFYSHLHPDHTGELVPFLFASKYPQHTQRKHPLTLVAGAGFSKFYKGLKGVYGQWIDLGPGMLDVIELDNRMPDKRTFDRFTVESIPVAHQPESLAYRVRANGKSVVYSGDTDVCESLVRLAADADLFICESALPDERKVQGHLTPSQAGEIASRANVRKLILTHFYPECDRVDIEAQCRKTYPGPLVLADDLMRFRL